MYLTFDDGPHPEITKWVMNELQKVNAKGTFFVVGENAERYPKIISEVISRGHQLGNHTYHHIKGWQKSEEEYIKEIEQCASHIPNTGLFRPPYGQINFKAIPKINENYEVIMWDVLTKDYLPRLHKKRALRRIKRLTKPGSIIVFHDSEKAEKNLKALLPPYLGFLKDNRYRMDVL